VRTLPGAMVAWSQDVRASDGIRGGQWSRSEGHAVGRTWAATAAPSRSAATEDEVRWSGGPAQWKGTSWGCSTHQWREEPSPPERGSRCPQRQATYHDRWRAPRTPWPGGPAWSREEKDEVAPPLATWELVPGVSHTQPTAEWEVAGPSHTEERREDWWPRKGTPEWAWWGQDLGEVQAMTVEEEEWPASSSRLEYGGGKKREGSVQAGAPAKRRPVAVVSLVTPEQELRRQTRAREEGRLAWDAETQTWAGDLSFVKIVESQILPLRTDQRTTDTRLTGGRSRRGLRSNWKPT